MSDTFRVAGVFTTLVTVSFALATGRASYFVAALVPAGFILLSVISTVPEGAVTVSRTVTPEQPVPGQRSEVTLTVRNEGDRPIPDLRVVDGVPESLAVTDGSPRTAAVLPPGRKIQFTYELVARRGHHEFGAVTVRRRGLFSAGFQTSRITASGDRAVRVRNDVDTPPVRQHTNRRSGRIPSAAGGPGVEFFATRQYHRGDPMGRVNWRQFAKTGELTTVEFRETRSATVVLLVDDREDAAAAAAAGEPTAFELSSYAALHGIDAHSSAGNAVGIATLSDQLWIPPARTSTTEARADEALGALQPVASSRSLGVEALRRRLPSSAQVVLFSPLLDDHPAAVVESLVVSGHPTTVVSPAVTGSDRLGSRIESVFRRRRLEALRARRVTTVDWSPAEPLELAVQRDFEGGRA